MATKRTAISKKTRFEVFKRDGFKCQYCGAHPPSVLLHVDHINPVFLGGVNNEENLITSCSPCNLGKGARSLTAIPKSLAEKAAETEEREEQIKGYSQILEAKRGRLEDETWRVMDVIYPGAATVPHDSFNSTRRFIEKLGLHEVLDSADIALGSTSSKANTFKYFCGVCWNKVREAS